MGDSGRRDQEEGMMDKDHLLSWEEIRKILSLTINKLLCQGVRRLIMLMQEARAAVFFRAGFGVMGWHSSELWQRIAKKEA